MSDQVLEEEFFDFKCPNCRSDASFPRSTAGQVEECPNCAEPMVVPQSGEEYARRIPVPAETERLTLRRLHFRDATAFAALFQDPELSAFVPLQTAGEPEIEQWLAKDAEMKLTTPNEPFFLAIASRDPQAVIGWATAYIEPHFRRHATLQVVIAPKHRRMGYGSEALAALLNFSL